MESRARQRRVEGMAQKIKPSLVPTYMCNAVLMPPESDLFFSKSFFGLTL